MNQKILAALSITAISLGVLNLALLLLLNPQISTDLNLPQEIPLESTGIDMQRVAPNNIVQFYRVSIYASIPDEPKTLYNCVFKMQYLTENDRWKTNTEYLGSVNFHNTEAYHETVVLTLSFTLDKDFNNDDPNINLGGFSGRYEGNNIKVEAYGYPKP